MAGELGPPAVHLPSRPRTSAMDEILSGISVAHVGSLHQTAVFMVTWATTVVSVMTLALTSGEKSSCPPLP